MDEVQAFKLGQAEPQAPVGLSGIDKLGERLARRIRNIIEPMAGAKPLVTMQPAEMVNYDLWSAMTPSFSAHCIYRLHPLKGSMMLRLEAGMISTLVERFYGGAGGKPGITRAEFTQSEDRLIVKLCDAIMSALVASWADVIEMDFTLITRETDPQALSFAEMTDQMLVQIYTVKLGKDEEWPIELMFPAIALRQLEPLLSSGTPEEGRQTDPIWRARIDQQMRNIRLPARTVLARPSLNLDELLALKPGDVIPVNIARSLPLIVGDRVVAHGTIGEQNGHAAFRIEKLS